MTKNRQRTIMAITITTRSTMARDMVNTDPTTIIKRNTMEQNTTLTTRTIIIIIAIGARRAVMVPPTVAKMEGSIIWNKKRKMSK
mmetsp:Transcript_40726/g.128373  ORF Transcript_40726/g.128373 Transcript_40726/m.128373 type:complete len:85 (+) Transcript_40726:90-344(+)